MSDYKSQLRDPRWQKTRLQIFDRDGYVCRCCGRGDQELHAHHLFYRKGAAPWEYALEELVTLCDSCHEAEHEYGDEAWRVLKSVAVNRGAFGETVYSLADALATGKPLSRPEWIALSSCITLILRMRRDGKNVQDLARQLDDLARDWDAGRDDEGFDEFVKREAA